jgi:hypothetical protein
MTNMTSRHRVTEHATPRRARGLCTLGAALGIAALAACGSGEAERGSSDTAAVPAAAGTADSGQWIALFDGSGLDRWRGYKRQDVPTSWKVVGDTLLLAPGKDSASRGDLVSRDQYGDFELEYEWRITPAGNSGVMWRVSEDQRVPWETGPEQQVLDDERHADGKIPSHRAGALYDLVVPPPNVARPVGEFNQARVVAQGSRVQTYLNGQQTADVDFASDSGRQLLAKSKFAKMPRFAQNQRGHIVLQDHDDSVYFRNIRVRPLGGGSGQ